VVRRRVPLSEKTATFPHPASPVDRFDRHTFRRKNARRLANARRQRSSDSIYGLALYRAVETASALTGLFTALPRAALTISTKKQTATAATTTATPTRATRWLGVNEVL
jgi:hypothetical protein